MQFFVVDMSKCQNVTVNVLFCPVWLTCRIHLETSVKGATVTSAAAVVVGIIMALALGMLS